MQLMQWRHCTEHQYNLRNRCTAHHSTSVRI